MSGRELRWGILGCGSIARSFALDLGYAKGNALAAVASRERAKAEAFADGLMAAEGEAGKPSSRPKAYASYEELCAAPDVDVVYIATPHPRHCQDALLALNGGKHVLVEKPMALNRRQGDAIASLAKKRGLFCMEAVWTRFLPPIRSLSQRIDSGELGKCGFFRAEFCLACAPHPESRMFAPALGGGSLLDLGIYPLNMAHWAFRERPSLYRGLGRIVEGVDYSACVQMEFPGGGMASCASSVVAEAANEAWLAFERAQARIPLFWMAREYSLKLGKAWERFVFDYPGRGYQFEAEELSRLVDKGAVESPLMPVAESLDILSLMDGLRASWGQSYPGE